MQTCLKIRKDRESGFHHCVCAEYYVQACLSARTVVQNHFNHSGSPVKLVQACLNAREDEESIFSLVLSSCKARAGLLKCQ